jgi:hypothetical protein
VVEAGFDGHRRTIPLRRRADITGRSCHGVVLRFRRVPLRAPDAWPTALRGGTNRRRSTSGAGNGQACTPRGLPGACGSWRR